MTWHQATLTVWAAIALLGVACQVVAVASRRRIPGLGDLLRLAAATPARRTLLVVGWLWLGWHTFAR